MSCKCGECEYYVDCCKNQKVIATLKAENERQLMAISKLGTIQNITELEVEIESLRQQLAEAKRNEVVWHRVEDGLPETEGYYYCDDGKHRDRCYFYNNIFITGLERMDVIAWAELPQYTE